ncbi:MAG: rhodanese-like domain-containing protein [Pyrinomonadaceae bacterium]
MEKIGLSSVENTRIEYRGLGVKGTPMLVLIGEDGKVLNIWRGYLRIDQRMEVLNALGFTVRDDFMISLEELGARQTQGKDVFVLDIRDRALFDVDHLSYANNIPMDELSVRALNEIPSGTEIVIVGGSLEENAMAFDLLDNQGFSRVHLLNAEL